jgi:hypothetical protein
MLLRSSYRLAFESAGVWPVASGWLIHAAIIAYAWKLRERGVLR